MSSTDVSAETPPLTPGAEVAPGYEVIEHLSRGHLLDVYDAWSSVHGARCVVKVVRPDRADDESARERLRDEGRLLRDLAHPHLVRAYALLEEPAVAVVLETLTGQSIEDLVADRGRLGPADVALLGGQVASALSYLHRHGWLHGDLTGGNVLAEGARAVVIDLSLATRPRVCRAGMGTGGYRAPEQDRGGELTTATDVYGLGAVLHEAATGRLVGEDGGRLRRDWPRRTPDALRHVVEAMLRDDPVTRPSLAEVTDALGRVAPLR